MNQTPPRQTLTVVVPAYNEAAVLAQFHARLAAVLDGLDVDAGVLDAALAEFARRERRFGQTSAQVAVHA